MLLQQISNKSQAGPSIGPAFYCPEIISGTAENEEYTVAGKKVREHALPLLVYYAKHRI